MSRPRTVCALRALLGALASVAVMITAAPARAGADGHKAQLMAGAWTFDTKDQGHPQLAFRAGDKTIFRVGCGHSFGLHAVYPGGALADGASAEIVISIAAARGRAAQRAIAGVIDERLARENPPGATHFVQWDLGVSRRDDTLYDDAWRRREGELLAFLDRGALTIAAGARSYRLPRITVRGWRRAFGKIC